VFHDRIAQRHLTVSGHAYLAVMANADDGRAANVHGRFFWIESKVKRF
jgi:hypothetical protein